MKLSVAVISTLLAPSTALSIFNDDAQKAIGSKDDLKIPGESPLEHCANRESEGYIEINSVDLVPNPPAAYVFTLRDWLMYRGCQL
jgi:hypothetical protein